MCGWREVGAAWALRRHCVGGVWETAWAVVGTAWAARGKLRGAAAARTHAPLHDVGREREVPVLDVVRQLDRQLVVRRRLEQPKHLRAAADRTHHSGRARAAEGRVCVCTCVCVCVCV